MKSFWLGLCLCTLLITQSLIALNLQQFNHVYFFGDSLTDDGYLDNAKSHLPAGKRPIYTSPQGQVWAYYIAQAMHQALKPNNLNPPPHNERVTGKQHGNDYAAGGARAPEDVPGISLIKGYNPPSLQTQIQHFLQQHHGKAPKHALYFVWIGANDILAPIMNKHALQTLSSIHHSITALIANLQSLQNAGATHIIVLNLPPLGETPLFNGSLLSRLLGNFLANYCNNQFLDALHKTNINVTIFDSYSTFENIVNQVKQTGEYDYGAYKITNATDSACYPHQFMKQAEIVFALNCIPPKNIDAAHYAFADWVHPSATAHHILALKLLYFLSH
jgi:outer membrane lipase/esterase